MVKILPVMQSVLFLGQSADIQHAKGSFDSTAIRWFGTKPQARAESLSFVCISQTVPHINPAQNTKQFAIFGVVKVVIPILFLGLNLSIN